MALVFCMCMGHDHCSHRVETQGHRSKSRIKLIGVSNDGNAVGLTSILGPRTRAIFLVCRFNQRGCDMHRKDTDNPPDVDGAAHAVSVLWKLADSFDDHRRQMTLTDHLHHRYTTTAVSRRCAQNMQSTP